MYLYDPAGEVYVGPGELDQTAPAYEIFMQIQLYIFDYITL